MKIVCKTPVNLTLWGAQYKKLNIVGRIDGWLDERKRNSPNRQNISLHVSFLLTLKKNKTNE